MISAVSTAHDHECADDLPTFDKVASVTKNPISILSVVSGLMFQQLRKHP
jgi:hypothetical protein